MEPYGSFGGGMGWGGWVAIALAMVVFSGLIAAGVVFIVGSSGRRHATAGEPEGATAALRILDDRFARGEIEPDDYNHRRQLLSTR